jgi:cysteine-rich repeat protein
MFGNFAKYVALLGCAIACKPSASDLFESPQGGVDSSTGGGAGTSSPAPVAGAPAGGAPMQMGGVAGMPSGAGASAGGAMATGGIDMGGSAGSAGLAGNTAGLGGGGQPPDPVPAVCGNGKLEAGEECDDGGQDADDGCSADCKVVCSDFDNEPVESADHHCFAGYDAFDYTDAVSDCTERGGHLATITDADENEQVRHLVNNSKWIGARDDVDSGVKGSGTYTWLDGAALSYANWAQKEPNQQPYWCQFGERTCYEHCVALLGDGTWADRPCSVVDGYVCEWDPAGVP